MDSEALLRETQATPNDANTAASNGAPDTATWPLQLKIEKIKPTIWSAYAHANCCALFRWLVNLLVLGATAMTVANGSIPKIMPFAIYSVACASIHAVLIFHLVRRPASKTSPMPPIWYNIILVGSPVMYLPAFSLGLASVVLSKDHFNEKDLDKVTYQCGSYRQGPCHPNTEEAKVFEMVLCYTCVSFFGLLLGLLQCLEMFHLWRREYTEEEIKQAYELKLSNEPALSFKMMRDTFLNSFRAKYRPEISAGWEELRERDRL